MPIDLDLGDLRALVISGPNTGGKTVALKTLGLAALLHQSGLRPPADTAALPVFDQVLADIGDQQSIEMSLSTFSGHVANLVAILRAASERSLVLLDEVAAGTDPVEGSALAQALLARLAEQARLTRRDDALRRAEGVGERDRRASRTRRRGSTPTRTRRCTASRSAGRGSRTRCRSRSGSGSTRRSSPTPAGGSRPSGCGSRSCSPRRRQPSAARPRSARRRRRERAEAAELAERAREREAGARGRDRGGARVRGGRARARCRRGVARARDRTRGARGAARRDQDARGRKRRDEPERDRRLGAASERAARAERAIKALDEPLPLTGPLAAGDPVEAPALGVHGTIAAIEGDEAEVVGPAGHRLRVPLARLRPSRQREPEAETPVQVVAAARSDMTDELDVRGQRAQEAREAVRSFVDDAALAGLPTVRVIHGRGTGAVRAAVRDELDEHPLVDSRESDSADGATVVHLSG